MEIVIVGPGAIGCLFAAFFTRAGHRTGLLDKDPDRAARISETGIRIEHQAGVETFPVQATADPFGLAAQPDFVCICVKSHDTRTAIRHALPLISTGTVVVSLQNGLGNAELIAAESGVVPVCAVTSHGSTVLGPGNIRHAGTGPTGVAQAGRAAMEAAARFHQLLEGAHMETVLLADHLSLLWSKAVVNTAINPVTALNNVTNGALLDQSDLRDTALAAATEATAVAAAAGIALYYESVADEVDRICGRTRNNVSSMLQDVRAGRRTEIEAITGAIVQKARELGLRVPVNESLLERVRSLRRQ